MLYVCYFELHKLITRLNIAAILRKKNEIDMKLISGCKCGFHVYDPITIAVAMQLIEQ